jgi:hypothetical protein
MVTIDESALGDRICHDELLKQPAEEKSAGV